MLNRDLRRCVLVAVGLAAPTPAQGVRDAVLALVRQAEARALRCGVTVRDLATDRVLVEHRGEEAFIPASNQKILTAAYVYRALGLDYEFRTEFHLEGDTSRPVLRVRASGDPTLTTLRLGDTDPFAGLVEALRARGVGDLGGLELDRTGWTGPDRPDEWPRNQLHRYYAAPTGPFVLEEACYAVGLTPTRVGQPVRVELIPVGAPVEITGRVLTTKSKKRGASPLVSRSSTGVRVSGSMWNGYPTTYTRLADPDPMRSYEGALRRSLRSARIRVAAGAVGVADASARKDAQPFFVLRSPLRWSLRRLLVHSSNFQAEQLLRIVAKERGRPASLAAGTQLLASSFSELPGSKALVVRDGSGLSRGNRVSPRLLTAVLRDVLVAGDAKTTDREPRTRAFLELFPQSGISGTIADRMTKIPGRVRAKTGWIRGASTLSGIVLTKSDRVIAFSILMNYEPSRNGLNRSLKALQDRIVEAIYERA